MENSEKAAGYFKKGFNCSQAVFSVFAPSLGVDEGLALKIACPFGAGMGRMQKTCGAVTGAFMAIGLKYGKNVQGDDAAKEHSYALVLEFTEKFKALHGSIECLELLGADMNTEEGKRRIQEQDMFRTKCLQFVKDAATIAEELVAKETA